MYKLEDLSLDGLKIIQDDELYKFTSDAVLLTKFAKVKSNEVVADFCAGSGIVGLHLYGLNKQKIKSVTMFEMQTPLFNMAIKSIELNNLQSIFSGVNTRLQDIDKKFYGKFSLCICNPPYMPVDKNKTQNYTAIDLCKSEVALSMKELVIAINKVLKFGGRACLCHRADRLVELICLLNENNLQPKRLQIVSAKNKKPYLVLVEAVKGGKSGVQILNEIQNDAVTGNSYI